MPPMSVSRRRVDARIFVIRGSNRHWPHEAPRSSFSEEREGIATTLAFCVRSHGVTFVSVYVLDATTVAHRMSYVTANVVLTGFLILRKDMLQSEKLGCSLCNSNGTIRKPS